MTTITNTTINGINLGATVKLSGTEVLYIKWAIETQIRANEQLITSLAEDGKTSPATEELTNNYRSLLTQLETLGI